MINLDAIKNTGAPLEGGSFKATAAISGMKSRFGFMCLKCAAKYETAGEYAIADTMVKTMAKQSATSGVNSVLYSLLGRIPVIGPIISGIITSAMHTAFNSTAGNSYEKAKSDAFEEVKGNFRACSRCGETGCVSCIKDGLCRTCLTG